MQRGKNEFVGGQYRTTSSLILPQTLILSQEVLKIHANSNPTSALNVHKSPKFPRPNGNRGRGTRW